MNNGERFKHQLDMVEMLDFCFEILARFLHQLWDDIDLEKDIRQDIMALYGDISSLYQDFHKITIALEEEWKIMYNREDDVK